MKLKIKRKRTKVLTLFNSISPPKLKFAFKNQTWAALRKHACADLFGYYDYNLGIDAQVDHLYRAVVSGVYQRKQPIQLEITKADLLIRRMQLPHPDEATIMTALANEIEPFVKQRQSVKEAYYGRSDTQQRGIHLMDQNTTYSWFQLWPRYQKQILAFARKRRMIVTTDIQNYFDSIGIDVLRTQLSIITGSDELPNLIIYLFENFAVRDRYSPYKAIGIPTIASDLPRLVAHCLLFELDDYLKVASKNCYTRWVDDINFGVSSHLEAREVIRNIERLLFKRGLRLGGGKTKVLDKNGVSNYIQENENQYLNVLLKKSPKGSQQKLIDGDALANRFLDYRENGMVGYHEMVVRRYYGVFTRRDLSAIDISTSNLQKIEKASIVDFREHPDTRFRETLLAFWLSLKPNEGRVAQLLKAIVNAAHHDDVITASALRGLTNIRLAPRLARKSLVFLMRKKLDRKRPGGFYGMVWLLAKYGTQREILEFVSSTYEFWSSHELFARQVVALWSLLPVGAEKEKVFKFLRNLPGVSVDRLIKFVEELETIDKLSPSLRGFLPPKLKSKNFDFYRAVISACILRSTRLIQPDRDELTKGIMDAVKDPVLRKIATNTFSRASF